MSTKREMVKELVAMKESLLSDYTKYGKKTDHYSKGWGDDPFLSSYLGSFMDLDPCGRYHHLLSPNGLTKKCEAYWERLDKAANEVGGWIESGEGDLCDIYFCIHVPEDEEEYR